MELICLQRRVLRGALADEPVEIELDVPVSVGSAAGHVGDVELTASWDIASNYNVSEQPASLQARFGDNVLAVSTISMLQSPTSPNLVGATVAGEFDGNPVALNISPGQTPARSALITGRAWNTALELVGGVASDLESAAVEGTVDGQRVRLRATSRHLARTVHVDGEWAGPLSLCLLAAGVLLYFVPA